MAAKAILVPCRRCCAEGLAFHASYTIPAVTKAMVRQLTRRGLRRSLAKDGSCVVQWAPFTKMNWNRVLAGTYHASASHWQRFSVLILDGYLCAGELISSCYYIHAGLVHKCLLYRVFRLLRSSAKGDAAAACAAAPISLDVPSLACGGNNGGCGEAFAEFRSRVHSIGGAWVLKEGNTNNAIAVHTFDHSELDAALALVSSDGDRGFTHPESGDSKGGKPNAWVVQQYVSDVLLLRGCKFHVRVNVLAVGNLRVYVHDDMVFHVACAVRTASYCLSRLCASARAKLTMLRDRSAVCECRLGKQMGTRDQSWRTTAPPRLQPRKENPDLVRIHDRGRCRACRRRYQTQVPGAEVGDTPSCCWHLCLHGGAIAPRECVSLRQTVHVLAT